MKGIYCYIDKNNDSIVYIGKDSHIDENRRHNHHMYPSSYNVQQINRVLQNNPDRYEYKVLKRGDFKKNLLDVLEILYIKRYKPLFNFTIGGDGLGRGFQHSEESKKRISENNAKYWKGKTLPKEMIEKARQKNMKHYFRIVKGGFAYGKQRYMIRWENKTIRKSYYIHKLYKWFSEKYPDQYLYLEVGDYG